MASRAPPKKPYRERVVEKRRYRFANGWWFNLDVLDDGANLHIATVGWGGYGGPASPEQSEWIDTNLCTIEGVTPQWMGSWSVALSAVEAVHQHLAAAAEHVGVYPTAPSG